MNSAIFALIAIVWLFIAYRWYGSVLEKKIIEPNPDNPTPAHTMNDGVDYYPARPMVLFGHHFASIAGAGPILGPVSAVLAFGWGVSALWILLGVVFFGAVHDYVTLMISVRHQGRSIPDVARDVVTPKARMLFMVFVWLALILVIAVFGVVAANTLSSTPEIVFPTFAIIPIAMFFGYLVYRKGVNLTVGSIIALALLFLSIFIGMKLPLSLPYEDPKVVFSVWFVILMLYGFIASILPVWLLLQPRDYIANWVLIIGMVLGFIGLFVSGLPINAPSNVGFMSSSQGPMWPMLFILIACGAISGFHSLVASGTTAKQLSNEKDGKLVAYGGMLVEGALATLALLAVAAGLNWNGGAGDPFALEAFKAGGPIKIFGGGYGHFVTPLVGTTFGILFGITMLKTFVMTTLDTSVRLTRFITTEMLGEKMPIFKNRWAASLFPVILAYLLGASGKWQVIWPMFGASNQLVAALALLVATAYLLSKGKPGKYTLYPAIFMLVTTIAALVYQGYNFLVVKQNFILGITAIILIILALVVSSDAWNMFKQFRSKEGVKA